MQVDFRIYAPNVKPITVDRDALNVCLMEQFGAKLEDQADSSRPNNNECGRTT